MQANARHRFRSPFRWLIITTDKKESFVQKRINDFHILIDSEVLVSERNEDAFTLYLREYNTQR